MIFNLLKARSEVKSIVKQVIGIDVAQAELVVCAGCTDAHQTASLYATHTFANKESGFKALVSWVKKNTVDGIPIQWVMEATGVYHERLAYYLEGIGMQVSIVLPNKISNYFKTLEVKTITDKTSAKAIARFGLERKLENWKRPDAIFRRVRQLVRERDQLVRERTMAKNQLHAEQAEADPHEGTLIRLKKRIDFLNAQEGEIKVEISNTIKQSQEVTATVKRLCTIPGVGLLTAAIILAETNGFELIRNRRQLASYAGFDVKEKQSGTSVKGKARISKRGNRYLRKAMHLPALTAIRESESFKKLFARLTSRHGIKMKAVVAVQRKLLELAYTLFKQKSDYDENYMIADKVAA